MARIIVVDDSEDICRLLKRALEKGWTFCNGAA